MPVGCVAENISNHVVFVLDCGVMLESLDFNENGVADFISAENCKNAHVAMV